MADTGILFQEHHDRIHRYILRMVRNRAEAEDLTQETFLRAHEHRSSLRDSGAVVGWLYRIATNVCLDRLRSRHVDLSLDSDHAPSLGPSKAAGLPSALEIAERDETGRCVQRCLEYLPESYRAVLLLYEGESLTAPEIAGLLGLRLTTVKMRLHRAHKLLREVMRCGCAVSSDQQGRPVCHPKRQRNLAS